MIISNICCCYSVAQLCPTFAIPWFAACQASWSVTIPWRLLKLMSVESVMPFNHLILCRPFLLLPSIFSASGSFPMSQLITHLVKVLELQL